MGSMLSWQSIQIQRIVVHLAWSAILCMLWIPLCAAEEPPLVYPASKLPPRDPNAIVAGDWLLYPTLRVYSLYSDNLFLTPVTPLAVPGLGVAPNLIAVWTNGIHTTTLYGDLDRQTYPTDNEVNTLDGRAGFTQRYEAMRDLTFSLDANYVHRTWATSLQNSIPVAQAAPTTSVLPNGNVVLPNGTIVSPTGQIVGQVSPTTGGNLPLLVNPSNRYVSTFSVEKLFNRGVVNLSASVNRLEYESDMTRNSKARTFTEHVAFWLGPVFYAYSDGSLGTVVFDTTSSSTTSYRVLGGLGTRQFGLFRGSAYFGQQGSNTNSAISGQTTAGGNIYGATLTYYPTAKLTIAGTFDRTDNISSQAIPTDLALTLPGVVGLQIPTTTSTRITTASTRGDYEITSLWFASWLMSYTRVQYVGSPRLDNSWVFDATLRYDIRRDTSLTWEYRYLDTKSNSAFASATSNFFSMGATHKF
jgi:hypothetical protein